MRHSWNSTPIRWRPLPIAGGIAVLAGLTLWKQSRQQSTHSHPDFRDGTYDSTQDNMPSVKGPWQVRGLWLLRLLPIGRGEGCCMSMHALRTCCSRAPRYGLRVCPDADRPNLRAAR